MLTNEEDLMCNVFEDILINRHEMEKYLKKLKENCINFNTKLDHNVQNLISKSSEYIIQVKNSNETIMQLINKKKDIKNSIENIKLEQKVIEKKTIHKIEEIEKTKTELDGIKKTKEKLSLEMVDLEKDLEESKNHLLKKWDAVRLACKMYKDALDIRIDTDTVDHVEYVTVIFFWSENPTDKSFFVQLIYENDCWKVKKIEPELSTEHKYQLNHVVQFSKQSEVFNVTALLCAVRNLFLKIYF